MTSRRPQLVHGTRKEYNRLFFAILRSNGSSVANIDEIPFLLWAVAPLTASFPVNKGRSPKARKVPSPHNNPRPRRLKVLPRPPRHPFLPDFRRPPRHLHKLCRQLAKPPQQRPRHHHSCAPTGAARTSPGPVRTSGAGPTTPADTVNSISCPVPNNGRRAHDRAIRRLYATIWGYTGAEAARLVAACRVSARQQRTVIHLLDAATLPKRLRPFVHHGRQGPRHVELNLGRGCVQLAQWTLRLLHLRQVLAAPEPLEKPASAELRPLWQVALLSLRQCGSDPNPAVGPELLDKVCEKLVAVGGRGCAGSMQSLHSLT